MQQPELCREQINEVCDDPESGLSAPEIVKGLREQYAGNQSMHI